MSELITLATLRTKVRERANMENSQFISDSELNGYIDQSYGAFYTYLANVGVDYFIKSANQAVTSGNTTPIPSDFLQLRGIDDLTDSNNPLTVRRYNFAERNTMDDFSIIRLNDQFSAVFYCLLGDVIDFRPIALAVRPYRIYYIPKRTNLSADSDTIDSINGWSEWVINDAAIKCLAKEESDTRTLQKMKSDIEETILKSISNRDNVQPQRIARIRNRRRYRPYGMGPGYTDGP